MPGMEARLLSPLWATLGSERRKVRRVRRVRRVIRVRRGSERKRGSGRRRIITWRWMAWC